MSEVETVVVGAGLAGLTCALELAGRRREVLLLEAGDVVGGRTASWEERGMPVESGLHRVLGFYSAFPRLLRRAGMNLDEVVCWEDELEFRTPGGARAVLGASPAYNPVRTLLGPLVSWDLLAPWDLASLVPFLTAGIAQYLADPGRLDRFSLSGFARWWRVTDRAVRHLLVPASAGVFFLPPSRYSAANFFGLLVPALAGLHRARLGAFTGGMTQVLANPLVEAIRARGGEVRTGTEVLGVRVDLGVAAPEVTGVDTSGGMVGARHVVVATGLGDAQRLLAPLARHSWFRRMLSAPTTPSVTAQFELDRPALPVDRTTFGPGTVLAAFTEQSRTTFPHARGRLSVILEEPERFLAASDDDIAKIVIADAQRIGIDLDGHVLRRRVVRYPHDFLSLEPGHLAGRPRQRTPVRGLVLAGDYTRQRFLSTMEGAVLSGELAARELEQS